jgi:hypothetical protein
MHCHVGSHLAARVHCGKETYHISKCLQVSENENSTDAKPSTSFVHHHKDAHLLHDRDVRLSQRSRIHVDVTRLRAAVAHLEALHPRMLHHFLD